MVATRLDPLSYGVDGLRGAFIHQSHFGVPTDLAVLGVLAAVFLALGARAFSKIQV
jgi:ABC-2 type transport system permease protein